jgi:hypothetical protein
MTVVRTSFRGAPIRIIFSASSTASADSVCAGAVDFPDDWLRRRAGVLAFAMTRRLSEEQREQPELWKFSINPRCFLRALIGHAKPKTVGDSSG